MAASALCFLVSIPRRGHAARSVHGSVRSCGGILTRCWLALLRHTCRSGRICTLTWLTAPSGTTGHHSVVTASLGGRFHPSWWQTGSDLRCTSPALTALDLCATVGGDGIDQALRARATTLAQLHRAMELTAARVGNRVKRQLLLDSRAEPWSKAERLFHSLLRDAGITGWRANRPVVLADSTYYVDVVFRKLKLAIEIDGRLYHTGAEVFESDRWRQNILVLNGWCVLRFTWTMIEERPAEVIAIVLEAIEMLTAKNA